MATDCEHFTPNARKIFELIVPHFPPDPWGNLQWTAEGKIYDNGWYDLRRSMDRHRLIEKIKSFIGFDIGIKAVIYRQKHKTLEGFAKERLSSLIQEQAERILLLEDLDFQIETMDLVES